MIALIQFDPETGQQPQGVWLSPTDSYYPAGTDPYEISMGKQAMERQLPDQTWEEFVDYLTGLRPVRTWWEQANYLADDNPRSIFARYSS